MSILSVINSGYIHERFYKPKDHMHCHVYNEGVAGKGSNNVASLIMKTFKSICLLNYNIFDICSGFLQEQQSRETSSFSGGDRILKKCKFVFLVVGHTKNSADILCSVFKSIYQVKESNYLQELYQYFYH